LDDRAILGDQLLRDNLRDLTVAFFKPVAGGTNLTERLSNDIEEAKKDLLSDQYNQELLKKAENKGMLALALSEIALSFKTIPGWLRENMPTAIMWLCYVTTLIVLAVLGVPLLIIIVAVFLIKIPEKAPLGFELVLRSFIPSFILYPKRKKR
jgi:hypothetical protein